MKSEIIPGAGGTTGGAGGPTDYDPLDDSSGSDSEDSDSGPNSESLTGSDEFVRVRMSSMDDSMMESEARQDDSRNESGVRQGDERSTLTSEPGRDNPAAAAGNLEDTDSGATASCVSQAALDQVTQKLGSLGLESSKASTKVEEAFVDGNVRGSEVGKGLIERPSRLDVVKVSGGTSSAEIAAAVSSGVSKVEARSEQSTGIKVPIHTIPSRLGITAFGVGQIPERSSRQSGSSKAYNTLADSSPSSNSPDACDHEKIAAFFASLKSSNEENKGKREPNSSVMKEVSLLSASQAPILSEYQTGPSPRTATTVSEAVATSSAPRISARPEKLKLQQDPLRSASLLKTQVSSGELSPEVFSAQELLQKNHPSYIPVGVDYKLEYAGRRFDKESSKASTKVEEAFVDGNVRGSEVGKGLIERPSRLDVVKVSGGTSSAEIAAASSRISNVEARSEQSTGIKVPIHTIPLRPGITAFGVGQIPESSSRHSVSSNAYNPLSDSSQSSSSSNSPDACDHDKIAEFSASSKNSNEEDKAKSEMNSSVIKEASLLSASQTLIPSEYQTGPSPRPATKVSGTVAKSSVPGISASSENTSQPGTRILRLSKLKLQQDPLRSASLVETQVSSGESSPEVFSAQGLPQKNDPSSMSVAVDCKLEYAGPRLSGAEETPSGIDSVCPEDLSKPTESGSRDIERPNSNSSNECLNKSTSAAAPAVARRTPRLRQIYREKGGILPLKIKPSPCAPSAVHEASSLTENTNADASVSFESSATVVPKDIEPKDGVRKSSFCTPPRMPALEPTQQFKSEKQQAPVQNSAPLQPSGPVGAPASPPDPDQVIQIYADGAKMHLKNLSIADIANEDESGFKFYCKAWFEAIVHERQWQQIKFTMIPPDTVEKVMAAYDALRSYVMRIEGIFENYICLPPVQISQQVSLQHLTGLNRLFPDLKELVESQAKHFAEQYEERNKEIIQLEGQVIGALIQMCGKYFEEEAVFQMGSNYFESEPLSVLLKPIEQGTREHFQNVCDFKVAVWKKKYVKIFDEEIEQRTSNVKSTNEQRRMQTQNEIKESINKAVEKYSAELVEKLKKQTGPVHKLQMAYQTVSKKLKEDIFSTVNSEFLRKWVSCPLLHENAVKDFGKRVAQIYDDESKKLLDQKSSASYGNQVANSYGITTRSQASTLQNYSASLTQPGKKSTNLAVKSSEGLSSIHGERLRLSTQKNPNVNSVQPGEKTTNAFVKPPLDPLLAFKDLPVSTLAIHMGLSQTSMGLFPPGTNDFVNLGRVENALYYRDDSILLAYDDLTRAKLGQPDLDFQKLIVTGRIDELVDVDLGGRALRVRKEQIFSSFLAALKWKAELETMMKLCDCVIVVPQFLNKAQRVSIEDAAKIAGFHDVKLIDDTTAIVLEYIMLNKISDGPVIAISALEGPIDIARFMVRSGVPKCNEISGSNFMKSKRPRNILARALNATWTLVSLATTKEGNEIGKMFSFAEFDVGSYKVEHDIKIFVGGEEDFISVKAALPEAPSESFVRTSELSTLRGGAYMAAICKWNTSCPIFSTWNSLSVDWKWKPSREEFEKELLSTGVKESKRASNFPSEKTIPLSKEYMEKIMILLKDGVEVHDVAMNAVRVLRAIEDATVRKQITTRAEPDVLFSLISVHLSDLQQPNLYSKDAKRILDDLVHLWREHVQGHGTPTLSQK